MADLPRDTERRQETLRAPLGDIAEFRRRKLRAQPRPIWVPFVVISAAVLGFVIGRLGGGHSHQE